VDDAVRTLARDAGLVIDWIDAADRPQRVEMDALRAILSALGLPCGTASQIQESRARVRRSGEAERPLVTAAAGSAIPLKTPAWQAMPAALDLEGGETRAVTLEPADRMLVAPPINEPGYHRLRFADREVTLAVAPARCVTVADIAPREKLYGLAIQLYALRRAHDDAIGDTAALTDFAVRAAHLSVRGPPPDAVPRTTRAFVRRC